VLLIDGDTVARAKWSAHLVSAGYHVDAGRDSAELEGFLRHGAFDLIVLDAILPGESGLSICHRLSRPDGPAIIFLSDLFDETDRIVGLEVGADDYLSKAHTPLEFLARVRAVLRRCGKRDPAPTSDVGAASWRLDATASWVRSPDGSLVDLTASECALLKVFADRPLRLLSRERLREMTRGDHGDVGNRTIDMKISRLRDKLSACGGRDLIQTQRNQGYIFAARVHPSYDHYIFEKAGRSVTARPAAPAYLSDEGARRTPTAPSNSNKE
jgi:two-component system OmpR family response regulator